MRVRRNHDGNVVVIGRETLGPFDEEPFDIIKRYHGYIERKGHVVFKMCFRRQEGSINSYYPDLMVSILLKNSWGKSISHNLQDYP